MKLKVSDVAELPAREWRGAEVNPDSIAMAASNDPASAHKIHFQTEAEKNRFIEEYKQNARELGLNYGFMLIPIHGAVYLVPKIERAFWRAEAKAAEAAGRIRKYAREKAGGYLARRYMDASPMAKGLMDYKRKKQKVPL